MATSRGAVCCSRCRARLSSRLHHRRARRPRRRTPAPTPPLRSSGDQPSPGSTTTPTARPTTAASRPPWQLQCTLATGRGFGGTVAAPALDAGYAEQRLWGDVDGNGGADYCRRVDSPSNQRYQCSLASAGGLHAPVRGAAARMGRRQRHRARRRDRRRQGRFLPRDHRPGDLLPVDRRRLRARLRHAGRPGGRWRAAPGSTSTPTAPPTSAACSGVLTCTLSRPAPRSRGRCPPDGLDLGYAPGRSWADIDGDGRADYCREVGNGGADQRIELHARARRQASAPATSPSRWSGDATGHAWQDFNGDGFKDFCRAVGAAPVDAAVLHAVDAGRVRRRRSCPARSTSATPSGRAWVDHNRDGKADYCRLVGPEQTDHALHDVARHAFGPVPGPTPPRRRLRPRPRRRSRRPASWSRSRGTTRSTAATRGSRGCR